VSEPLFRTENVWLAAALQYMGYGLCEFEILDPVRTLWLFAVPSEDAKLIVEEYDAGKLILSDTKSFVAAFHTLAKKQKDLKRRGERHWSSPEYVAGRVG
jgi:hypothetical protein